MSAQKPNTNRVIDYWPSWFDWNRDILKDYQIGGKKERVDVINISFALPEKNGTLLWNDVVKGDGGNYQTTKNIIEELKKQGKKVIIAVGGATAHNWNLENPQAIKTLAENIKKFVDEYGLNGVDIDYEMLDPLKRAKVADLIVDLRKLMPQNQYLLSYAAWSIGAYGNENAGHTHPEWAGGNAGIDIKILKEAGHLLDYVNVMSYDAFDPSKHYNPIEAIEAYKSLMGSADKVVLGLELGNQGWPENTKTTTKDVQPWVEYAAKNGFGGVMFWTLVYDFGSQKRTNEADGAFLSLVSKIMPKREMNPLSNMGASTATSSGGSAGAKATVLPKVQLKQNQKDEKDIRDVKTKASNSAPAGIDELNESNKTKILMIQQQQESQITILQRSYDDARKTRAAQLEKASPEHKKALENQYKLHDQQINEHLESVKKSLKDQLDYLIKQLHDEEKRTRPKNQ